MPTSAALRGRPRSVETRRAVLSATLDELIDVGLLRLTIEAVATRARVSKATIYRWWPDKVALALEALRELPELPVPDRGSLKEDLRVLRGALVELVTTTSLGDVLPVLLAERRRPEHRDAIVDYVDERSRPFRVAFERAIERGELPRGTDLDVVGERLMGPLTHSILVRDAPLTDRQWIDLIDATLAGIRAQENGR